MLAAISQKLREFTYRTSGRRSVTTSRSTAGCGASEFDACTLESVGSTKPVTCYSATMLDCVRHGCPTDETLSTLEKRVIGVSTSEKLVELQKSCQTPVCLLPTRKACREFNDEMLASLDSKVHELA